MGRIDAFQRRHPVIGLPVAVVYKFFDDQGGYLAVMITYYGFVSVVPMLLLATTVLGFVLQGDPSLQGRILDSAIRDFPVVGDQLGRPEGLRGSPTALLIGSLAALYGSLGLGTALQNAVNTVWAVPRNSRPNPLLLRLRSLVLLITAGLALLVLSSVPVVLPVLFGWTGPLLGLGAPLAGVVVMALLLTAILWLAEGRRRPLRRSMPGAVVVTVLWQGIQVAATLIAQHAAAQASAMNQTFGLVLGLIAVTYLAALALVLGLELNVVLTRRLWPRALLTPFSDDVALTPGDKRAYAGYVRSQRHKGFQYVVTGFREPSRDDPEGPDDGLDTSTR
ncbi:YihY/virulence factor BrkB family protein [Nocardioides sp. CBS4Y-1]|uniref:YihY/virulence factor BrkB family protein n=1 Tax=Nocardioides acrostichi TaxID=2784339 RepID=A0A930UYK9_9ACTN|nr:YihY/virulence factor BrkB family protein [Nocardioides acrostichi]